MISLRLFFGILCGLIAVVQLVQQALPSWFDPFAPGQGHRLARLDQLLNPHLIEYKLRHLRQQPPFALLLFGNSSILSQNGDTLGGQGRVFNMAVPGSSFGSSVSLINHLAATGRLAPTTVVMVENFTVYDQQVPMLPAPLRWSDNIRMVADAVADPLVPKRQALRLGARLLKQELGLFTDFLNPNILSNHLAVAFADYLPEPPMGPRPGLLWGGYRSDGSGGGMIAPKPGFVPLVPSSGQGTVLPAILDFDLRRLASEKDKTRLIVYESPLEPANQQDRQAHPQSLGNQLRRSFLAECARLELECHPAPLLGEPGQPNRWMDHYHPPGDLLGVYLLSLLRASAKVSPHAVQ